MLYKNKHAKKRKDVSLAQEDEEQRRKEGSTHLVDHCAMFDEQLGALGVTVESSVMQRRPE